MGDNCHALLYLTQMLGFMMRICKINHEKLVMSGELSELV